IRDAHLLKEPEALLDVLLGDRAPREQIDRVAVFVSSKDLDGRKKFTKTLLAQAAVIPCEEIPEHERDAWIQYLLKKRDFAPQHQRPEELFAQLRALDPWTLDIVDQELERMALEAYGSTGGEEPGGGGYQPKADFVDAFFSRRKPDALLAAKAFASHPDEALPLLGLMAWNARHLALLVSGGGKGISLSPLMMERMRRWARAWNPEQIERLQTALGDVDYGTKQTALSSQGLWAELVLTNLVAKT
ncbi:MAG: hypothetical protein AAB425_14715, partial [Bdellovibrionota bacterium]